MRSAVCMMFWLFVLQLDVSYAARERLGAKGSRPAGAASVCVPPLARWQLRMACTWQEVGTGCHHQKVCRSLPPTAMHVATATRPAAAAGKQCPVIALLACRPTAGAAMAPFSHMSCRETSRFSRAQQPACARRVWRRAGPGVWSPPQPQPHSHTTEPQPHSHTTQPRDGLACLHNGAEINVLNVPITLPQLLPPW